MSDDIARDTATEVSETIAPGSVAGDLDGDGRLDAIEHSVQAVHETVTHIAEVVEGLAETASGTADQDAEVVTGRENDADSTPVPRPWTHRRVW